MYLECFVFLWYVFPTNLGDYMVVFYWLFVYKKLFKSYLQILFIEAIIITRIFFILMSNEYWNKFWRYRDIWVRFKESKGDLSCFIW